MPFFSHWWEVLVLIVIILIVFGPGKLPQVGGAVGAAVRHLRRAARDEPAKAAAQAPGPGEAGRADD